MLSSACGADANPEALASDDELSLAAADPCTSDPQNGSSCGTDVRRESSDECAAVCGNGVLDLDVGEECDPGIAGWSQTCSADCKQLIYQKPCSTSADCIAPGPPYAGNMWCSATHVCIPVCGTITPDGETAPPSVCPAVPTYSARCVYPLCFLRCSSSDDCPEGIACNGNVCGNLK